jgi:hypothetical protein
VSVACDNDNLHVTIEDGRVAATLAQRSDLRIIEDGAGIVWGQLDDKPLHARPAWTSRIPPEHRPSPPTPSATIHA